MTLTTSRHSFISFSSLDEKNARAVCNELERRQTPCWISSRDVRPGRNYQSEIIEAIRKATHLVLVFSDNANRSAEVARELSLASKNRIPICPIRIKDVLPSGGMEFMLATSQWVDAFADWNGAMDRLAAEIAGQPIPPRKPPERPPAWRRALPALTAAAAVAAVAAIVLANGLHHPGGAVAAKAAPAIPAAMLVPAPPPRAHMADVEHFAASLDCAHVVVLSTGAENISLSGFVGSAADEERLLGVAHGLHTHNDLAVLPYPFCAVHGLAPALGAAGDLSVFINHPDGRYLVGDPISGSFVPGGRGKLWVAADLISFDGSVFHLLPAPGQVRIVQAGDTVKIGAPRGKAGYIEAADPPGPIILLVIASDKPLPPPARFTDTARAYLPKLQESLAKLGATLSIGTYEFTTSWAKP